VDASLYGADYFLHECEGYEEFAASDGHILSDRLATAVSYADVQPGMRVLDIGCGRGETLAWLMRQGVEACGVDYASEALRLARGVIQTANTEAKCSHSLIAANACRLPFSSGSFDRALMLDIVEHLHPWELEQALDEVARVLRQDGKLIVHTAPNLWYYRYGYPFFRLFERFRGNRLPRDPRLRFRFHQHVHVNEQSPRSLAKALRHAGFRPRVWLEDTQRRWAQRDRLTHLLGWLVTHCYPLRWVFSGDVLGVGCKVKEL
jgi:SAM-dependent methyltransferase